MEFRFDVNEVFGSKFCAVSSSKNVLNVHTLCDDILDCQSEDDILENENPVQVWRENEANLRSILDVMGEKSAKAQGLRAPITSTLKLLNSDQRLYVMIDSEANYGFGTVVGILKVGVKKLFMRDMMGVYHEVNPLCILDFYVCESIQRKGFGHSLFEIMLKFERVSPVQLAIDQPSVDLLMFLKKYYGLHSAVTQANKFAVFPRFFIEYEEHISGVSDIGTNRYCNITPKSNEQIVFEKKALHGFSVPSEFSVKSDHRRQKHVSVASSTKGCLQWSDFPFQKSSYNLHHGPQALQVLPSKYSDTASSIPSVDLDLEDFKEKQKVFLGAGKMSGVVPPVKQTTFAHSKSTAMDNSPSGNRSRSRPNDLLSSWNVMGVQPPDFSRIKDKERYKSLGQEFLNTRPPW